MIFPEIEDLNDESLVGMFKAPVPGEHLDEEQLWFDEIAHRVASFGEAGFLGITDVAPSDLTRIRAVATGVMSLPTVPTGGDAISRLAWDLLGHADTDVCVHIIDSMETLQMRSAKDRLVLMERDSVSAVRGAVLRYLSQLFPQLAREYVVLYLQSSDDVLIENAIDEADALEMRELLPAIARFQSSGNKWVRQAADSAVSYLELEPDA